MLLPSGAARCYAERRVQKIVLLSDDSDKTHPSAKKIVFLSDDNVLLLPKRKKDSIFI